MTDLNLAFWGIKMRAPWTAVHVPVWNVARQHTFILWLTRLLGPDLVSVLTAMGPAMAMPDTQGKANAAQVALMEQRGQLRATLQAALEANEGAVMSNLLTGVTASQAPVALPQAPAGLPPLPGFTPNPQDMGVTPVPAMQIALWEKGPMVSAPFNEMVASVFDLYGLLLAIVLENLFPLDDGAMRLRDSAKGWAPIVHVETYTGKTLAMLRKAAAPPTTETPGQSGTF